MMDIEEFGLEFLCQYNGYTYSVRKNGEVKRHANRKRKTKDIDEKWTRGLFDKDSGFLLIDKEPVHMIVASAYIDRPSAQHKHVEHIDGNKQNNNCDNLRWVENIADEFVEQDTQTNLSDETISKYESYEYWISLTEQAVQANDWTTPCEFPNCPNNDIENPILMYSENLADGAIFLKSKYGHQKVVKTRLTEDNKRLYVIAHILNDNPSSIFNPYALACIFYDDILNKYVHYNLRTYRELQGAEYFLLEEFGEEDQWEGELPFDYYIA